MRCKCLKVPRVAISTSSLFPLSYSYPSFSRFLLNPRHSYPLFFFYVPIKSIHPILYYPSHACIPYPSNPLFHARDSYSPTCMAAFITHQNIRQTHFLTLRPSHIHYPSLHHLLKILLHGMRSSKSSFGDYMLHIQTAHQIWPPSVYV